MKKQKIRSPYEDRRQTTLSQSFKQNIQKQLEKPVKPITHIFSTIQQQQQKRNAHSIKKILMELTDLKKQLKEVKKNNKSHAIPQDLDMSVCRKLHQKSPSPPHNNKSHSSSRRKGTSATKEISTQTKPRRNEVNEFSFSIDQKSAKKARLYHDSESEQQQEQECYLKKREQMSTKRFKHTKSEAEIKPAKETINERIAAIEANQLYERHLNTLKHNTSIIQLSSILYSNEDKLKLNIQLERISKNIRRIPMFMSKEEQYYETLQLYARNINNQLNNIILVMNRCHQRSNKLRERSAVENNIQEKISPCKHCQDNEKRGVQKHYRKQIKRYTRELKRYEDEVEYQNVENKRLKEVVGNLMKEIDKYKEQQIEHKYQDRSWESKYNSLQEQKQKIEKMIILLENQKQRQQVKNKSLLEDIKYYKEENQKLKNDYYDSQSKQKKKEREIQQNYLQCKNKELQMVITQMKGKEELYQNLIKQKEQHIEDFKERCQILEENANKATQKSKKKKRKGQSDDDSVDSEAYYKIKHELRQNQDRNKLQRQEISSLTKQNYTLSLKNQELNSSLDQCFNQIQKLHTQIDNLHRANQRYKDKHLKTKILTQKKSKKEIQSQHNRVHAFRQINELIKHHREGVEREKK